MYVVCCYAIPLQPIAASQPSGRNLRTAAHPSSVLLYSTYLRYGMYCKYSVLSGVLYVASRLAEISDVWISCLFGSLGLSLGLGCVPHTRVAEHYLWPYLFQLAVWNHLHSALQPTCSNRTTVWRHVKHPKATLKS